MNGSPMQKLRHAVDAGLGTGDKIVIPTFPVSSVWLVLMYREQIPNVSFKHWGTNMVSMSGEEQDLMQLGSIVLSLFASILTIVIIMATTPIIIATITIPNKIEGSISFTIYK
jgi:hypothetical protein